MDNTLLNKFYDDHVKMIRDETKQNIKIVMPIVEDILQYVHSKDRRFKCKPLNVGSYYTHLKVSRADEFDFSVVLDTEGHLVWSSKSSCHNYGFDENNQVVRKGLTLPDPPIGKGFISLSGIIPKWNREGINDGPACLTIDDDIIPIKVKRRFKSLVGEAVNRPHIRKYVDAKRLSDSPATTLTITHPKIAGDSVSVDLTPLIESCAPFRDWLRWPRPEAQWPSDEKEEKLKSIGLNNIAKDPFYWTYSYASCEKELLDGIDANGTCRKKSQRIMKKLKESWCPEGMKQDLTSYHLKNILFWECEDHPHDYEWSDNNLATRLSSMCNRLLKCIREENVPQYFHPRVNLFSTKDIDVLNQVAKNIQRFLRDPVGYLQRHY